MAELATSLVPAAEEDATPEALALLRIFAAIGSPELRRRRPTRPRNGSPATGVPDPDWASLIGSPTVGEVLALQRCRRPAGVGDGEFGYGESEHALSVLIDHGHGGKIKDAWVDEADGLLDKTWLAAENDPLMVFETIDADDARGRLEKAIGAGECPDKQDQADDLTAHRALLLARMRFLAAS